jgi:hypothetical protein
MRINPNNFIGRSACGVTLALLFGTTPIVNTYAAITKYKKTVPNLEGTWLINPLKSDDPQDKVREALGGRPPSDLRGRRSPSVDGFPEGPPQGGVPERRNFPTRDEIETVSAQMEERLQAAYVLEIIQSSSEITVNETGNDQLVHTQTFYTDGRKSEQHTEDGKVQTIAQWQGDKLVVEMRHEGGGKITRTYGLQSEGSELYVTLKIENEHLTKAISIHSVYDKSE